MTTLDDALAILDVRHAAIVAAYESTATAAQLAAIATEALERLGIDPDAAALADSSAPSVRLALDVGMWAWVEAQAALGFDFSADGGSYQRSQLAANAARMRRQAEDRAVAAGLAGFDWPAIEVDCLSLGDCYVGF